ncbi:MAG: hypothetical protein QXF86_03130 [Candidatus Bilamarchaeaceae archaeon]
MIEEMIEEMTNLSDDELADAIVEVSTALRDLEIQFYLTVGKELLKGRNEMVIKTLSGKRQIFFNRAKLLATYWDELQQIYTKDKTLTDLLDWIKENRIGKKNVKRRILRKAKIEERLAENLEKFKQTGDLEYEARAKEDEDLLQSA